MYKCILWPTGKLDAPLEPQRIMGEMCWGVMLRVVECECVSVCVRVLLPRYMPLFFFLWLLEP